MLPHYQSNQALLNMDNEAYFRTITDELHSLKDRIRNFIGHRLTDGEWKESILRTVLRRHLPKSVGVGKGFVITPEVVSTQIDLLLYDATKPVLYQDGDLLILSPDAALGAIEVKTRFRNNEIRDTFTKLSDIAELMAKSYQKRFFGFFTFEGNIDDQLVLDFLQQSARGNQRRVINCVSIGNSYFARYWEFDPAFEDRRRLADRWQSYDLINKAPAYFIFNVIEHLCPNSVGQFDKLWFPQLGKEPHKVGCKNLRNEHSQNTTAHNTPNNDDDNG